MQGEGRGEAYFPNRNALENPDTPRAQYQKQAHHIAFQRTAKNSIP
jgi:hypothetical protein